MYKNTRRPCYVSEKAYNCPVREIWAVSFVKANGRVGAIPTYRVYRLYDILIHDNGYCFFPRASFPHCYEFHIPVLVIDLLTAYLGMCTI